MAYKIRWSPRAVSDLEEICNFIAKDSAHYAFLFAKKVNAIIVISPLIWQPNWNVIDRRCKIFHLFLFTILSLIF